MKKNYISNSQESVRMFKNDFLEALSKVHFFVPLIVYIPVIIYCVYKTFTTAIGVLPFFESFIGGLFIWTFVEYILHRFIFHYMPKPKWAQRLHFIFHGVHHDYPSDAKRLVMPPSASIPLAVGFSIYSMPYCLLIMFMLFSLVLSSVIWYMICRTMPSIILISRAIFGKR
jgi:4-hydroxysphinganine ceramide fatty acyl 2-hydroxylase